MRISVANQITAELKEIKNCPFCGGTFWIPKNNVKLK